jgi:predicted secreted protein
MRHLIIITFLVAWATTGWSHPEVDARNRVSLQVEANREIANDWTTARLSVVAEGKDPAAVAASVNRQMTSALKIAKGAKGVDVSSGAYVTQPVYDDGRVVRWRASQILRIESGDVDRLSTLIGELQEESVLLSGIEFSVKPETRNALKEELIKEALALFRSRAALVATAMGEKSWSLISLSIGDSGGRPRMMHMQAEASTMSRSAPPAFEAGTSDIRVQASGNIELDSFPAPNQKASIP